MLERIYHLFGSLSFTLSLILAANYYTEAVCFSLCHITNSTLKLCVAEELLLCMHGVFLSPFLALSLFLFRLLVQYYLTMCVFWWSVLFPTFFALAHSFVFLLICSFLFLHFLFTYSDGNFSFVYVTVVSFFCVDSGYLVECEFACSSCFFLLFASVLFSWELKVISFRFGQKKIKTHILRLKQAGGERQP